MPSTGELIRRLPLARAEPATPDPREWLVANGLGGYSSGVLTGAPTRRYHGLLVAALPPPLGRAVMLDGLAERAVAPGGEAFSLGFDWSVEGQPPRAEGDFRLELGLPVWRFRVGQATIERRILMPHGLNATLVAYRLLDGPSMKLDLRPALHMRRLGERVGDVLGDYALKARGRRFEAHGADGFPTLRMMVQGARAALVLDEDDRRELEYVVERRRGYDSRGPVWSPGCFVFDLHEGEGAALVASTEPWEKVENLRAGELLSDERRRRRELVEQADPRLRTGPAAELVIAADAFVVTPPGRHEERARLRAAGDDARSVIAGYHWFTDWGRDTMISLEGLTLLAGRHVEAGWILRTFAYYMRDGLIPNMFPEGERDGLYHTADATLWFFHAFDRYLEATHDRETLRAVLPKLVASVEAHMRGTRFGIHVDPEDGLLRQGAEGYQLTWMDAKVDNWVVTPRRGKAVEINALWHNALRLLDGWVREERVDCALDLAGAAEHARASFNRRFWCEERGHLYDVVDGEAGDDPACRPNQIFAIALKHPVLDEARWAAVLDVARTRLLTPLGLRSLSRDHPDYKEKYFGDLRARDAAYHQGTVWAWLIGPFVEAWLKLKPDARAEARGFLEGFLPHLDEAGIGAISEIFDAEPPYAPEGCIAQAWSVAEFLRAWALTAEPQ